MCNKATSDIFDISTQSAIALSEALDNRRKNAGRMIVGISSMDQLRKIYGAGSKKSKKLRATKQT